MQHYSSQAFTDIAKPAGGATIAVKIAGTNNNATIYSDDGITQKSNPFNANAFGQFDFYAASGKYDITISGTQITTYTLPNQVLFDPFEQTAADTAMVVRSITASNVTGPFTANSGLTIPNGQVLAADQILPVNSAGVGGFFGWSLVPPPINSNVIVANANEVRVVLFFLPFFQSINKITYKVVANAAGTADVGLYNSSGNRVLFTNGGINTNNIGIASVTVSGGPISLVAGYYYLAWTCTSNTPTVDQIVYATDTLNMFNQNANRFGTAANNSTAGVLPATLGAITASVSVAPIVAFFER